MGVVKMSMYRTVVLPLCLLALLVTVVYGGSSKPAEDDKGEKKSWKKRTKSKMEPGVMRCDPFGDYGSFTGIENWDSEKFDGRIKTISGKKLKLKSYAGKSLLIANVAATPEDAAAQFQVLNGIAASYPSDKLEVLGFWSAEFADKSLSDAKEFRAKLKAKLPKDFKLKFMIADMVKTNGPRRHSCFRWLKDQCASEDIAGDFTKFLTTRQGRVHRRYEPSVADSVIKSHIDAVIDR